MLALIVHRVDIIFALAAVLVMGMAVASAARSLHEAVVSSQVKPQASITILYSEEGAGKTHLMSEFEGAFLLPLEDGTAGFSPHYRCHWLAWPGREGVIPPPIVPKTLQEFNAHCKDFVRRNVAKPGERKPYSYLMIDGLAPLERLVHAETCRQMGSANMEEKFGTWTASLAVWGDVWAVLEDIRSRGVHVWIAAHAADEPAANTSGDTYRRKTIRMLTGGNKNAPDFAGMMMGRADNVWFLAHQVDVIAGGRGKRATAKHAGRVIYTKPTGNLGGASYKAKSRYKMPDRMAATPEDIRKAMAAGITRPAEKILADLALVIPLLPAEQRAEIVAERDKANGHPNALERVLSRAQGLRNALDDDDQGDEPPDGAPADLPPRDEPPPAVTTTPLPAAKPEPPKPAAPADPPPPDDDGSPADVPGAASPTATSSRQTLSKGDAEEAKPFDPYDVAEVRAIAEAADLSTVTTLLERTLGKTQNPELRSALILTSFERRLAFAKTVKDCGTINAQLQYRQEEGEKLDPVKMGELQARIAEKRKALQETGNGGKA